MRIISLILVIFLLYSCCNEIVIECVFEIQDEITESIHFDKLYCGTSTGDYEKTYYSLEDYLNDTDCVEYVPIPIEIGFNGIISTIGVEVPYAMPNISSYEPSINIIEDSCEKSLSIEFVLQTIDTTQTFVNNKTVVVFLEGYDDTYEIDLSSVILPL